MIAFAIDDVHPESSQQGADCSGDMEDGVFRYLLDLVREFPDFKITLFVTPNWIYKPQPKISKALSKFFKMNPPVNKWPDNTFKLTKFPHWCDWIRKLVKTKNFEVAIHGLYHFQPKYPYSAEFQNLDYEECMNRIADAEEILYRAKRLIELNGDVIMHGHIAYTYHGELNPNGIDEHSYFNIREIIKFVKENYRKTSFVSLSELAKLS